MVSGTGIFTFLRDNSCAETPRICSKRRTTSRPFLSPASVTTVKWADRNSCHWDSAAYAVAVGRAKAKRRSLRKRRPWRMRATGCRRGIGVKGMLPRWETEVSVGREMCLLLCTRARDGELTRRRARWVRRRCCSRPLSAPSAWLASRPVAVASAEVWAVGRWRWGRRRLGDTHRRSDGKYGGGRNPHGFYCPDTVGFLGPGVQDNGNDPGKAEFENRSEKGGNVEVALPQVERR